MFAPLVFAALTASTAMAPQTVGEIRRIHLATMLGLNPRGTVLVAPHAGVLLVVCAVGVARSARDLAFAAVIQREDVV